MPIHVVPGDVCPICYEEMEAVHENQPPQYPLPIDVVRLIHQNPATHHYYHAACIRGYWQQDHRNRCPNCREGIDVVEQGNHEQVAVVGGFLPPEQPAAAAGFPNLNLHEILVDIHEVAVALFARAGRFNEVLQHLALGAISENTRGWAVQMAAQHGHREIVQVLLMNGAISDGARGWAVKDAAEQGYREIVQDLLSNGAISENDRGWAVRLAAENGYREIVQDLLANGAVISMDRRGWAVKDAAEHGYREIVQDLLANGAVISEIDRELAVQNAAEHGYREIVQDLLANGAVISEAARGMAVKEAARVGHLEIVRDLLNEGNQIYGVARGEALKSAAQNGHREIVQILLQNGPIYEVDRQAALQEAHENGHHNMDDLLALQPQHAPVANKGPLGFSSRVKSAIRSILSSKITHIALLVIAMGLAAYCFYYLYTIPMADLSSLTLKNWVWLKGCGIASVFVLVLGPPMLVKILTRNS